jgi:competence protein ComEA
LREKRKNPALLIRAAAILICAAALSWSAGAPRALAAKKIPPSTPVNINEATLKELEEVPGIGPTTAKAIIQFRTRSGRFRRVNDLLVIRGVSEGKLAKMRPYVTVGAPPAAATSSVTKKTPAPPTSPAAKKPLPPNPSHAQPRPPAQQPLSSPTPTSQSTQPPSNP